MAIIKVKAKPREKFPGFGVAGIYFQSDKWTEVDEAKLKKAQLDAILAENGRMLEIQKPVKEK